MNEVTKSVVSLEYGEYCDGCASKECCMVCVLRSKVDKLEQQLKEAQDKIEKMKCCANCENDWHYCSIEPTIGGIGICKNWEAKT